MRRFVILVVSAIVVVGCSASPASNAPSPSPASVATVAPASPTPPPPIATPRPTPTAVPVADCPTGTPLTVRQFIDADPACFEGTDITIRAWLDTPPPLGFEPPFIEPAWLAYPQGNLSTLWQERPTDPEHICSADEEIGCAWFFFHIDPASGLAVAGKPRWLLVTGHRQDPAAETCHWVDPDGAAGELPDDSGAVLTCRGEFVLVSFRNEP